MRAANLGVDVVTLLPHLMTTPPYDGATAPAAASCWGGKQEGFVMDHRLVLAPTRPVARSFAAAAATTMLAALLGT